MISNFPLTNHERGKGDRIAFELKLDSQCIVYLNRLQQLREHTWFAKFSTKVIDGIFSTFHLISLQTGPERGSSKNLMENFSVKLEISSSRKTLMVGCFLAVVGFVIRGKWRRHFFWFLRVNSGNRVQLLQKTNSLRTPFDELWLNSWLLFVAIRFGTTH